MVTMNGLVYSPKEKIPLFKLMCDSSGNRSVEYHCNGRTELIEVSRLVIYLIEVEMTSKNEEKMIYSPTHKIPLGFMLHEPNEACFIEVKYKSRKDRIRLTTYVKLLLEADALKAS